MPTIDVYAAADLFPAGRDGQLAHELTMAVLRAEGVKSPGPFHLNNTAPYIHRMDPHAVHTAATESARKVRVQVITPPGALTREGQKQLVKEVTEIVARISGDSTQASRTWVLLTEAAEGGWGLSGTCLRSSGVRGPRGQGGGRTREVGEGEPSASVLCYWPPEELALAGRKAKNESAKGGNQASRDECRKAAKKNTFRESKCFCDRLQG